MHGRGPMTIEGGDRVVLCAILCGSFRLLVYRAAWIVYAVLTIEWSAGRWVDCWDGRVYYGRWIGEPIIFD